MSADQPTLPILIHEEHHHHEGETVEESKRSHTVDAAIDFIGGINGAIASVYVGQSLDTVKVKMQTFPHLYRNALDCFLQTYRQDGVARGLYAGTVPALVANIAENSVLFLFYGLCQKAVMVLRGRAEVSQLSPVENAFSGSGAAFFCAFTLTPTELVKCRLQAMREMASQGKLEGGLERLKLGPWGITKEVLQVEGIRGLFKGLTATMAREMPGYFFFFGGYEFTRHMLTPEGKTKDEIGAARTVVAGGVGGLCLWSSIFPTDVVKSRIQVESTVGKIAPGFLTTFNKILKTEGPKALYKGLGPTLVRTFPATGSLFLAYETTKKFLTNLADGR
ncbi:mitochondrial ornithine transporter 1 [Magallana gigas]|uniref:Mitochondrial ornithine transporter 1 n=2 Tax=Magallana gigas TaxID=29159 RepID=A0A8W8MQB9_MAGGI|nr:mitochondrial ornithine transporter 1 [Crassostrea gigas]|eukprot:XP_011424212.1 PREDICTED: mitochondrial ornithine transporter 1 [Crassostrea gigas]